jgi:pimeloyl-ACP methyl ester carboxylesterase/DNA-binding CsgD family transcriptional regulator
MPDRQKLRFCTTSDGVRIAYATTGSGLPLVKAANWLSHLEYEWQSPIWRHWVESLSRGRAYVRYDSRGCGLSDREPRDMSAEAWLRDLEAVVDATGFERFALLGASRGGATAIEYATRHPERVSHLVLYGAFARGRLKRGGGQEKIEETLLYHRLAALGWGTGNAAFRQVFTAEFLPGATPDLMQAFDDLQRASAFAADAVRLMEASAHIDVTGLAPRVSCPTLVLHARNDLRVPFEEGRVLAALIPGARLVPLESRNHILLETEPAWSRFLEEVNAFLPVAGMGADTFGRLSARERELLELLARGLDNHQIAARLGLKEKTVRNHISSVFAKLGVESRAQAIVRARDAGFGIPAGMK